MTASIVDPAPAAPRATVVVLASDREWTRRLIAALGERGTDAVLVASPSLFEDAVTAERPAAVLIELTGAGDPRAAVLAALARRELRSRPRVVAVADWKALVGGAALPAVDRVLVHPLAPAEAAALLGAAPGPDRPPDAASLVALSVLGLDPAAALTEVARGALAAFGARQAGGFFHDRDWIELGADPAGDDHQRTRQLVLAAATAAAPVVSVEPAGAVVHVATFLADGDGRRIAALWLRGHVDRTPGDAGPHVDRTPGDAGPHVDRALDAADAALLGALGRRLGVELAWSRRAAAGLATPARAPDAADDRGLEAPLLKIAGLVLGAGRRAGEPVTVALAEIADLERLAARHGRATADELRHHVAAQIVAALRGEDVVVPLPSGPILALLPGATAIAAGAALQRAHDRIAAQAYVTPDGTPLPVGVAIGGAAVGARGEHGAGALQAAADALAQARHDGRSPYVVHAEQSTGDLPTIDPFEPLMSATFADGYRLLNPISSGAVGVVYRAEDLGLARPVAIKILRHELARNHAWVMRFRQEAAILASLRHPNIVQAYACGEHDGTSYLVMELVEGASIKDMLERSARDARPIALDVVAAVLRQIASALDALHAAGIVHRDVKPANILMDPFRDRAVLVDVGIAQRRGADRQAAGTLGYMAPEVIEYGHYDARADVFSLAVTGFEMIFGRQPWPPCRTPMELLHRLTSEAPLAPSELDPAWAPLDAPMAAALAIDPAQRLAQAGELAARFCAAIAAVDPDAVRAAGRRSGQQAAVIVTHTTSPEMGAVSSSDRAGDAASLELGTPRLPTVAATAAAPQTRAAVFRQLAGVVAARELAALRETGDAAARALAVALDAASSAPLAWISTAALADTLRRLRPDPVERGDLAQALGRAVIRTTFRRLFPASGATLAPSGTLSALPNIWPQYHTWGAIATALAGNAPGVITITGTLHDPDLCALSSGMFEQLILLSGGTDAVISHVACEAHGDSACEFEAVWQLRPYDRARALR